MCFKHESPVVDSAPVLQERPLGSVFSRKVEQLLFVPNKKGAVLFVWNSPTVGEGAIVLFAIAAEFAYQHYYKDNWKSDQSKHEEKSKAHHDICILSCFILLSV